MAKKINITAQLNAATTDGILADAGQIFDAKKGKFQEQVNEEFENALEEAITSEDTDMVVESIEEGIVHNALRKTKQILTEAEKEQARENIGAVSEQTFENEAVRVKKQVFTSEQKYQARHNISAITAEEAEKIAQDKINETAVSSPDKLQAVKELSSWLEENPDNAATMNEKISENYADIQRLYRGTGIDEYSQFSTGMDYTVGDVVLYDGVLFRFKADHAKGEWDYNEVEEWSEKKEREASIAQLGSEKSGIVFTENGELNGAIKELYIEDTGYLKENKYYFTAFQRNYSGNNKSAIRIGVNDELETIIWQSDNYTNVQVHEKRNDRMFFRIVVDWGKIEEKISRNKIEINHCAFNKLYSPTLYSDDIGDKIDNKIDNIKSDIESLESNFQPNICSSYPCEVKGWGNVSIENEQEIDYFGEIITAEKVTIDSASPTGNMLTLPSDFNIKNAIGKRINFCVLIHSEIEASLNYTLYPNVGTLNVNTTEIKIGWNKIHANCIITDEYTSDYAVQFIVVENQAFLGTTMYVKGVWYLGEKKHFIPNLTDLFVEKEPGKSLIPIDTLNKIENINFIDIARNITKKQEVFSTIGSGFVFESTSDGLSIKKEAGTGSESGSYAYINYLLDNSVAWKKNHEYYIAIDMVVNSDSKITSAGFYQRAIQAKWSDSTTVGTTNYTGSLQQGVRGLYKAKVTIDKEAIDAYPTANHVFFQFGHYSLNDYFDAVIYEIFVSDLGEKGSSSHLDWDTVDLHVTYNGLKGKTIVEQSNTANRALVAERVLNSESFNEIDIWGDSLTAQNWDNYLEEILGRKVYAHGYGGKTSTFIRDLYISNLNKDRAQVIWVGRNNYSETDVVIDDIRDMVSAFGRQNFIVMSPPNGDYGTMSEDGNGTGEMKGGDKYNKFIELEERLSQEYPSNYLNIRKAVIQGWRMGNIKLLENFTQPNIGDNVQIAVSGADFLTSYNPQDLEGQGESFMKKIRIGINGKYDVYSVVSKDDSTHLTIKLEAVNYKQPNEIVANITDSGGNNAIKYLRVMQNADYMCWINDTTLSTYRSDRIHITEDGRKLVAEIVARKIKSLGI